MSPRFLIAQGAPFWVDSVTRVTRGNRGALGGQWVGGDDLDMLRRQLADRLTRHPPSTWSPSLLAVVVNAVDLQFGDPGPGQRVESGPRLRVVR